MADKKKPEVRPTSRKTVRRDAKYSLEADDTASPKGKKTHKEVSVGQKESTRDHGDPAEGAPAPADTPKAADKDGQGGEPEQAKSAESPPKTAEPEQAKAPEPEQAKAAEPPPKTAEPEPKAAEPPPKTAEPEPKTAEPPVEDPPAPEPFAYAELLPPKFIDPGDPEAEAPAPGPAPPGDSRSFRRVSSGVEEFFLIYRSQNYLISRSGIVGKNGTWRVIEYPSIGSAAHAYAQECSALTGRGFRDLARPH